MESRNTMSKIPIESEKVLEPKLVKAVKAEGGWAIKLLATFVTGIPDRMCLFPGGRIVFVEMKTTGQKPRKIQRYVHRKLVRLGFIVLVIDSTPGIENLIQWSRNGCKLETKVEL